MDIEQLFKKEGIIEQFNTVEKILEDSNYKLEIGDKNGIEYNRLVKKIMKYKTDEIEDFLDEVVVYALHNPEVEDEGLEDAINEKVYDYTEHEDFVILCQEMYAAIHEKSS